MKKIMRRFKLGYRMSREMSTIPEEPEDGGSKILPPALPPSPEPEAKAEEEAEIASAGRELTRETVSSGPSMQLVKYVPPASIIERSLVPMGPPPRPPRSPPPPTASRRKSSKRKTSKEEEPVSEDEINQYTSEHAFTAQHINSSVGTGLVATEFIPAGSILFAERIVWISAAEQAACATISEANELIGRKVRAMGDAWHAGFLSLTNPGRQTLGLFAGIWEAHQVVLGGRKQGAMVGLNVAWMNHACVPNCALTVVNRRGGSRRAVVRVCADVDAGAELTIAYFYAAGGNAAREMQAWSVLGFVCGCAACLLPAARTERALRRYARVKELFEADAEDAVARPALAFQLVQDVVAALMGVGVRDARVAMLWTQCALLAGFHADVARAVIFLGKARKMLAMLEGPAGRFYAQVARWHAQVALMPGFAASTRGLSNMTQAIVLPSEPGCAEILYMNGALPHEYLRVDEYRRLPGCVAIHRGAGRYKLLAPGGKEVTPDPSTLPPDMAESMLATEKDRKPRKSKIWTLVDGDSKGETQCKNEKDFLDVCREMRRQHMQDFVGEQRKASRAIPRSIQDDIQDLHRCLDEIDAEARFIQKVAARKNVVVNKCMMCEGEVMEG